MFLKYSGLVAIFFAWFLVVLPGTTAKQTGKFKTISHATKSGKRRQIIHFGLIAGALAQIGFLYYLTQTYSIPLLNLSVLLYFSTNIATLLVPIFTMWKHKRIHEAIVTYYFFASPISLLLISVYLRSQVLNFLPLTIIIVFLYFIGQFHLIKTHKGKNSLMEQWAFLLLAAWTVFLTFS